MISLTQTFDDLMWWIVAANYGLAVLFGILFYRGYQKNRSTFERLPGNLGALALTAGLLAIVSAPGQLNKVAIDLSFLEPGVRRIVIGTGHVILLSGLLFAVKLKDLIIYAAIEAGLAWPSAAGQSIGCLIRNPPSPF